MRENGSDIMIKAIGMDKIESDFLKVSPGFGEVVSKKIYLIWYICNINLKSS